MNVFSPGLRVEVVSVRRGVGGPGVPSPAHHAPPVHQVEQEEEHREDAEEHHVRPGEPLAVAAPLLKHSHYGRWMAGMRNSPDTDI